MSQYQYLLLHATSVSEWLNQLQGKQCWQSGFFTLHKIPTKSARQYY